MKHKQKNKVWDISKIRNADKNTENVKPLAPMFSLTHSETVQSIKWRPKRKTQITACSTQLDAHLYVWDFKRPYVPYASFDFLTNKVKSNNFDEIKKTFCFQILFHLTLKKRFYVEK